MQQEWKVFSLSSFPGVKPLHCGYLGVILGVMNLWSLSLTSPRPASLSSRIPVQVHGHVLVVTTLDLTGISLSSDFLRFPICQQYCPFWSSPSLFGRGGTGCTFQCVIILDTRKLSYFREVRRTQTIAPSLLICWGLTLGLVTQEHLVGHPLKSR